MGTSKSVHLQVSHFRFLIMSSTTAPVNTFNKSKEDFIWFVKKAVQDQKSYSYSEMYHCLLKMFVDADTNKDGLVSKSSFSKLIDAAASLPRAYGYAPEDSELYKTEAEKDAAADVDPHVHVQLIFHVLQGTGFLPYHTCHHES